MGVELLDYVTEQLKAGTVVKEYGLPKQSRAMVDDLVLRGGFIGLATPIRGVLERFTETDGVEALGIWLETCFPGSAGPYELGSRMYNSLGVHLFWRSGADWSLVSAVSEPIRLGTSRGEVMGSIFVQTAFHNVGAIGPSIPEYLMGEIFRGGSVASRALEQDSVRGHFLAIARKEN